MQSVRGDELVRPSTPTTNTRSQLQISDPNLKLQISNPISGLAIPTRDRRATDTDTERAHSTDTHGARPYVGPIHSVESACSVGACECGHLDMESEINYLLQDLS